MLRVDGQNATPLSTTTPDREGLTEDDLREWLLRNTKEFFDESLLVIGREVSVEGIGDGIDVLAIDRSGNLVVLELKRGALTGNVDFQMLKYVSYVSRWEYGAIKKQFQRFVDSPQGTEIHGDNPDFNETLEEFCNDDYDVNGKQRMIFVGNTVRERIGSVILWLREQNVDASIVEFELFKNNADELYLDAQTVVPTSKLDKFEIGEDTADKPWKEDGRAWHLEERANPETAAVIENLLSELREIEILDEPSWQQKYYIALRVDGKNRVLLKARKSSVRLEILDYPVDELDSTEIADETGLKSDQITLEPKSDHGRDKMTIDCHLGDGPDVEAIAAFISRIIVPVEA